MSLFVLTFFLLILVIKVIWSYLKIEVQNFIFRNKTTLQLCADELCVWILSKKFQVLNSSQFKMEFSLSHWILNKNNIFLQKKMVFLCSPIIVYMLLLLLEKKAAEQKRNEQKKEKNIFHISMTIRFVFFVWKGKGKFRTKKGNKKQELFRNNFGDIIDTLRFLYYLL